MSYLDKLREIPRVELRKQAATYSRGVADPWIDYLIVTKYAGREYEVGTATVYHDGEVLVMRSASRGTVTKYRAWRAVLNALGTFEHAGITMYSTRNGY